MFLNSEHVVSYCLTKSEIDATPKSVFGRILTDNAGGWVQSSIDVDGLSWSEVAVQRGFVCAAVDRLPKLQRDVLVAKYMRAGLTNNRMQAITAIAEHVGHAYNQFGTKALPDIVRCVLVTEPSLRLSYRQFAKLHGCAKSSVERVTKKMGAELTKIEAQAFEQLDELFCSNGLVPDRRTYAQGS